MDCMLDNLVARVIKDDFGGVAKGGSEVFLPALLSARSWVNPDPGRTEHPIDPLTDPARIPTLSESVHPKETQCVPGPGTPSGGNRRATRWSPGRRSGKHAEQ